MIGEKAYERGRYGISQCVDDEDVCGKRHRPHVVPGHIDYHGIERTGVQEETELCQKHPRKSDCQVGSCKGEQHCRYADDEAASGNQQVTVRTLLLIIITEPAPQECADNPGNYRQSAKEQISTGHAQSVNAVQKG